MRTKTGTKSYYSKKLDKYFSEYIRKRAGKCEKCGRTDVVLQCAHIIPRTNKNMRWDPFNALALCYKCHIHWSHKDPIDFTNWFKRKYPNRYRYLAKNRNKLYKSTSEDLKELMEYYKSK